MNEDEILLKSLKNILTELRDEYEYYHQFSDEDSLVLAEECKESAEIMEDILPDITDVDSLDDLSDDDYSFVYEMLQAYAEVFIIVGTSEAARIKGEKEYEAILDLLDEMESDFVMDEEDEDD